MHPLILAFDTSAAHCTAALLAGDRVIAQRVEPMARGQAERLMPLLEELLAESRATWADLTALGVGVGPGNFTGIRIAVSAARGLALGLDIPAVGVTGFEALGFGIPEPVLAILSGPAGQVYVSEGPKLVPLDAVPGTLGVPGLVCVGDHAEQVATVLDAQVAVAKHPMAEAIARLAAARFGQTIEPPRPLYVRPPDAAPSSEPPPVLLHDT